MTVLVLLARVSAISEMPLFAAGASVSTASSVVAASSSVGSVVSSGSTGVASSAGSSVGTASVVTTIFSPSVRSAAAMVYSPLSLAVSSVPA